MKVYVVIKPAIPPYYDDGAEVVGVFRSEKHANCVAGELGDVQECDFDFDGILDQLAPS